LYNYRHNLISSFLSKSASMASTKILKLAIVLLTIALGTLAVFMTVRLYCWILPVKYGDIEMLTDSKKAKNWAEKHSVIIQNLYDEWQKPLGIDCEYQGYLKEDMLKDYHDPLKKDLYEFIF
jgi:hypothetical protein